MHLLGQDDLRRRATERTRDRYAAAAAHRSLHFGLGVRARARRAHRVGALEDGRVRGQLFVANRTIARRRDGRLFPSWRWCRRRLGALGKGGVEAPFRALPRFRAQRRRCRTLLAEGRRVYRHARRRRQQLHSQKVGRTGGQAAALLRRPLECRSTGTAAGRTSSRALCARSLVRTPGELSRTSDNFTPRAGTYFFDCTMEK